MQILTFAKRLLIITALCLPALPLGAPQARADAQPLQLYEDKIKAALVYDFLKYTNWSDSILAKSNKNIQLCLLGDGSFDNYLYLLKGRTIQQYPIVITTAKDVAGTGGCSLVFVHRNQEELVSNLLQHLNGSQILTVSDIDRFASKGGMVEIRKRNNHIEFFVNKIALNQSGLIIQNRLLKLARTTSE